MELIKANQILLLHSVFEQFGLLTQFLFIVAAAPSVPEGNVVCRYIMRLVIDIPPQKEEIRKRFPGGLQDKPAAFRKTKGEQVRVMG